MSNIGHKIVFAYGEQESNPMPSEWVQNMEDFKRLHEGWEVHLLTIENAPEEYLPLYQHSKILWAQAVRFDHVAKHGGFYSDLDVRFFKRLPALNGAEIVLAVELHGKVTDAFFGARKDHPLMCEARDRVVEWAKAQARAGGNISAWDILTEASVTMFTELAKNHTGFGFDYQSQIHMDERAFAGNFHPENGVGILPFEALCRHSVANWFGWHMCHGTWRPKNAAGAVDMDSQALVYSKPADVIGESLEADQSCG